jgi:hypothetical protein
LSDLRSSFGKSNSSQVAGFDAPIGGWFWAPLDKLMMPFCLMCCEKHASGCHRKLIADYLVNRGYEVEHLE